MYSVYIHILQAGFYITNTLNPYQIMHFFIFKSLGFVGQTVLRYLGIPREIMFFSLRFNFKEYITN